MVSDKPSGPNFDSDSSQTQVSQVDQEGAETVGKATEAIFEQVKGIRGKAAELLNTFKHEGPRARANIRPSPSGTLNRKPARPEDPVNKDPNDQET